MAQFECTWCGKCCRSFGEFIRVERQLTERDYYCRDAITNEIFQVHVQPEFMDDVGEDFEEIAGGSPREPGKGCMFLRRNPQGPGFACAIYPTRPTICREFICYRMLIHHPASGEVRGRVIGINELRTKDEVLQALWNEKIAVLPHPFRTQHDSVHRSHTPGSLAAHGQDSLVHAHIRGQGPSDDREWVAHVLSILESHGYRGDPVE